MSELFARFRYALTYLSIAALCVISITSRQAPIEMSVGSRWMLRAGTPLQRMVTLPLGAARDLWTRYVAVLDAARENLRLREQLARLEEENLQYREEIVASERFQRLAGFRARRDVPMVPANVVAHDLSPWFRSVIIDQGAAAGIEAGMPVITDLGLVGVVAGTTPREAKVLLMIDLQSRVDAFVQRTRARGTVRGRSREECDLEYLPRDADVREGDVLLTSGVGELYPKGLVVGRVVSLERKPWGLFQRAEVKPAVDFQRLEEVFVLLERRELPPDESFSSEGSELWADAPQ
jgi:rod shape-determining protein MreC